MPLLNLLTESTSIPSVYKLQQYSYEVIDDDGAMGFSYPEEAKKFVKDILIPEIEELYRKRTFNIYRVIGIEEDEELDDNYLGYHYTLYKENLFNRSFYEKIGLPIRNDMKYIGFTVSVKFNDVDWETTIDNRLMYPTEDEINLNPSMNKPTIKDNFIINKKEIE